MVIIAFIGLLLFGKRLPEVGRSLGKGIVEFKKGLRGIEDEVETAVNRSNALPASSSVAAAPSLPPTPAAEPVVASQEPTQE